MYGLYDVYNALAKAQHGVSKVNQLPWEYDDRLKHLEDELTSIINNTYSGYLRKNQSKLSDGLLPDDFPVVTEVRRLTRRTAATGSKSNEDLMSEGKEIVSKFAWDLNNNIKERIETDNVAKLIRDVFKVSISYRLID